MNARIHRTLRGNIGSTLFDIHHSMILFDLPPRVLEIKTKINKADLIQLRVIALFLG